jgi:hypothetical protein
VAISVLRSCCLHNVPHFDKECCNIVYNNGHIIPWVLTLKDLGIYLGLLSSCSSECCFNNAKRSYIRSLNGIFGTVGRSASEQVILEMITSKYLPILIAGIQVSYVTKTGISPLDFAVTRF